LLDDEPRQAGEQQLVEVALQALIRVPDTNEGD